MKKLIISYSLSGNNKKLADGLAERISANHISISELKKRTIRIIIFDMIFQRIPRINLTLDNINQYDLIFFVGPVWMGQTAAPFRACFDQFKFQIKRYIYISISGGADGPNLKLSRDLSKRLGIEPNKIIDLHIADLLPTEPKPIRKDTSSYKINKNDVQFLLNKIIKILDQIIFQKSII
jgi:flavodoxin